MRVHHLFLACAFFYSGEFVGLASIGSKNLIFIHKLYSEQRFLDMLDRANSYPTFIVDNEI